VTSTSATARIAVDARMLDTAGIGTYLKEVLPRLIARMPQVRFTLLGDDRRLADLLGESGRLDIRCWMTPIYSIREQLDLGAMLPGRADLLWVPHFNIPLAWRGPLVVTVHDVAHLALPQASPLRTLYARAMFGAVRRRASVVLCDSAFTEREFLERVGPPRRTRVCHLGVAPRWFELGATESPVAGQFLLYVGNIKPHKNLRRLLEAFAMVAGEIPHRLVIIGRQEGMRTVDRDVAALAASLGERVVVPGFVPQLEVERYVASCHALVLPSLYEGFGLPPLEALACGRAVAVSGSASLPEICGPVAEYFDPLDVASISAALRRIATRPPDSDAMIAERRAWARRFDWEVCADQIATELGALLATGRERG
jgi:glycosyltransferase involved in cell wall biosynthesis